MFRLSIFLRVVSLYVWLYLFYFRSFFFQKQNFFVDVFHHKIASSEEAIFFLSLIFWISLTSNLSFPILPTAYIANISDIYQVVFCKNFTLISSKLAVFQKKLDLLINLNVLSMIFVVCVFFVIIVACKFCFEPWRCIM